MPSSSDSDKPRAWNPDTLPTPAPSYDQVAVTPILPTSKLVTLAGQTGTRVDGTTPIDFLEQVKGAYRNVHEALKAAGATPRDIIHVRHYIVTKTGNEKLDEIDVVERGWDKLWIAFMDEFGEGHRPPDTVLGVASLALGGLHYEVECWAIVHG